MPALPSYIPARDADLVNWSDNFSTLLTASPATYGLISGDAVAVAAANTPWQTAYTTAIDPSTRTPVAVQAKDDAKISMLATIRPYAQLISLNAGVLASDKIAIGVNPRTSSPTPISAPVTNPILAVVSTTPLQHVLRYRDESASPSVKSKPYGVLQIQIFCSVSATVITDQNALDYKGVATKSPFLLSFDPADAGKQAYYAARWITRRGLIGPWSPIVNLTVTNG